MRVWWLVVSTSCLVLLNLGLFCWLVALICMFEVGLFLIVWYCVVLIVCGLVCLTVWLCLLVCFWLVACFIIYLLLVGLLSWFVCLFVEFGRDTFGLGLILDWFGFLLVWFSGLIVGVVLLFLACAIWFLFWRCFVWLVVLLMCFVDCFNVCDFCGVGLLFDVCLYLWWWAALGYVFVCLISLDFDLIVCVVCFELLGCDCFGFAWGFCCLL